MKTNWWKTGGTPQKIDVLPHFQNLPAQTAPDPSAGRAHPVFRPALRGKRPDRSLARHATSSRCSLQIAGEGPQRAELESLTRDLDLANVEFVGQVAGPQLDRLISSSRFTVLPSRAYETLGKTILESYAWGRAVVASDLGSRRELVHEGETGVLFRAGDVAQLAAAISFLIERPELAAQMGAAGRTLVAKPAFAREPLRCH